MHTDRPFVKSTFCKYVREFRCREKLSKAKMAERLHMDPSSYSALEKGVYGPSGATLILFILQLSPQEQPVFLSKFQGLLGP